MNLLIFYLFILFTSFIVTFSILPWLIEKLTERKILGTDMNKSSKPKIPEMGGISVLIGFVVGVYVQIFLFEITGIGIVINDYILCSLVTAIGVSYVGILDDLIGIRQRTKAFLPFMFALPLGFFTNSVMFLPYFGEYDFGYLMLFLVPFAITCASNSTNMLEGFNGLGTGLSIIICSALSFMAIINEDLNGLYLLIPLLGSLLAFWYYNKYPAKIFPGDTLTMFMGAVIACAAIASNLRLEGAILLTPMILEFFLKFRGRFSAESFATKVNEGILIYDREIQSLTHILMSNFELTEKKLVEIILIIELTLAAMLCMFSYFEII